MDLLGSFVIAFSMYSRIPMPRMEWTEERMRYAMCFFPLIGVVIGGAEYLFFVFSGRLLLEPAARALVGTAIPLLLTGGIHMDGFLDVTDARYSLADREKRLAILKDPHTGAFAIIGFGLYLLFYVAALLEMRESGIAAFCVTFVLTRALSGLAVVTFPMAREDGLAAAFSKNAVKRAVRVTMYGYVAAVSACLWALSGRIGLLALAAALIVFLWYRRMALREFGGITGDLAGYFLQICELVLLMVLCLCGLASGRAG